MPRKLSLLIADQRQSVSCSVGDCSSVTSPSPLLLSERTCGLRSETPPHIRPVAFRRPKDARGDRARGLEPARAVLPSNPDLGLHAPRTSRAARRRRETAAFSLHCPLLLSCLLTVPIRTSAGRRPTTYDLRARSCRPDPTRPARRDRRTTKRSEQSRAGSAVAAPSRATSATSTDTPSPRPLV